LQSHDVADHGRDLWLRIGGLAESLYRNNKGLKKMSAIFGRFGLVAPIPYTPTFSSGGGAFSSAVSINSAERVLDGKMCDVYGDFTLPNPAGGSGPILVSLPFAAKAARFYVARGIVNSSKKELVGHIGIIDASTVSLYLYDGTAPIVNGERYMFQARYSLP
jgi:hypothetical protein